MSYEQFREQCAQVCAEQGSEWDSDAVVTEKNYAQHCADLIRALPLPEVTQEPVELTVWYGSMPESNGKHNYTAMLMRKGASMFDGNEYTFQRSEYPDRVRYEADCMRHLIGEIAERPDILAYDANKHSGYVNVHAEALRKENEQLREKHQRLERLLSDDGYAISFQTFGQYRTALIKSMKGGAA